MSIPSAEVAADFKDALGDLKVNSRPEISNLTIIAKENTEHAQAISRELENHIRSTRPEFKLPALYVLDSIVKNVGTPYTVYLGRNLYKTFMDAYMVMDPSHRRAMDGLLKTWKQPVPESMDPRPVFSAEVTRDIENALIKFRTVAVQQQALSQRLPHGLPPRPPTNPMATIPWRNTPTPPQNAARFAAPNDPRIRQQYPSNQQYGLPTVSEPPAQFSTPQAYPQPVSSWDLDSLKGDLAKIITSTQTAWALNPSDTQVQQKLKALLDLQTILKTQTLPPQQLQAVRTQIQALSPPPPLQSAFAPPHSAPPMIIPPAAPPTIQSPQQTAIPTFPPAGTPVNLAQILANARATVPQISTPTNSAPSLAEILRGVSTPVQLSSTPTTIPPFFPPPLSSPLPSASSVASAAPTTSLSAPLPTANLAELLARFNNAPSAPAAQQPTPPPPMSIPALPSLHQTTSAKTGSAQWLLNALKGIPIPQSITPMQSTPLASQPMTRQTSATSNIKLSIDLTTESMKVPRLHLISTLYEARSNICATCGRRFENTPDGKEKKARHMDWHFKVKDPDAVKRGVHRSWYISEKEWIDYREVDETAPGQAAIGSKGAVAAPRTETKDNYVPVPTDIGFQTAPCPICQENWKQQWHPEANDFVWMDAVEVNGKIYHATCWEEYCKGAGIAAPSTPDSVLGKRKADPGTPISGKKIRAF